MGGRLILACGDCAGGNPPPDGSPLGVILIIVGLALIGGMILLWQRRRRQRPRRVTDYWSTLIVMGELCPHGWQAEISFHGVGAPTPDEEEPSRSPPVAVEWKLYEDESKRVTVERRVSAETIEDALQRMVDDRRLDVALEEIEQSAAVGNQPRNEEC
jgi:hypothetical protein